MHIYNTSIFEQRESKERSRMYWGAYLKHKNKLNGTLGAEYSSGSTSEKGKLGSLPTHIHLSTDFRLKKINSCHISLLPWQISSQNDLYSPYLCLVVPMFSISKSGSYWEACLKPECRNIIWWKTVCNCSSKELYFVSNVEHCGGEKAQNQAEGDDAFSK